jgi:hypothetical protein
MSVRATERLVGDVVVATKLPNSAKMVVQSVDEGNKLVTTIWFCDEHSAQTGVFPASSLDRAEQKASKASKSSASKPKSAGKPKSAAKKPARKR